MEIPKAHKVWLSYAATQTPTSSRLTELTVLHVILLLHGGISRDGSLFANFLQLWPVLVADLASRSPSQKKLGPTLVAKSCFFFSSVFVQEKCRSLHRAPFTTPLGSIVATSVLGWWTGTSIIWILFPTACTNSTPETYNINIKFYNSLQYYLKYSKLVNILLICGIPKLNSHARNLCQNNISDLHPPSSALWPSRARLW